MNSASKTVNSDKKRLADFKQKVKSVLTQLDLPIVLYAATDKDKFRKPRTGMWDKLLEAHGLTQEGDVDLEACYFVGDAGGRTAISKSIKADFSCSDRSVFYHLRYFMCNSILTSMQGSGQQCRYQIHDSRRVLPGRRSSIIRSRIRSYRTYFAGLDKQHRHE